MHAECTMKNPSVKNAVLFEQTVFLRLGYILLFLNLIPPVKLTSNVT